MGGAPAAHAAAAASQAPCCDANNWGRRSRSPAVQGPARVFLVALQAHRAQGQGSSNHPELPLALQGAPSCPSCPRVSAHCWHGRPGTSKAGMCCSRLTTLCRHVLQALRPPRPTRWPTWGPWSRRCRALGRPRMQQQRPRRLPPPPGAPTPAAAAAPAESGRPLLRPPMTKRTGARSAAQATRAARCLAGLLRLAAGAAAACATHAAAAPGLAAMLRGLQCGMRPAAGSQPGRLPAFCVALAFTR